ncbi:amino acid deaminase [Pseudoxanthomonas broegbernensis]|uniref:Amino acid deaminase n=1 Tax=Pseudoxanthomonas broegbernensis TaxID=83619 RepID=A0A7V8GKE5_9GAMM|nr:amino acid deaminase [Pseudoxanthomonas broegbernensis]KAF1684933.1 amino acid deaminase [Pseudoxanthomonas broegbernensis]MBB6066304.1 D-serine dehydratase [Pseudoxanthomonas broegbernensis]
MSTENSTRIPLSGKGLGAGTATPQTVADLGWRLLEGEVSLPAAVLRDSALRHNLAWMGDFIAAYGLELAPHGKTTMSPELFALQLEAGAWGITLATAPQVRDAYRHGVRRVLMANQLVDRANMAIVAGLLADAEFEFCCLVDSVAGADALGAFFGERGLRLRVLLEVGAAGGRTGVRDPAQAEEVVQAIARWPRALALAGVEVYEGVLKEEAGVRALLRRTLAQFQALRAAGAFAGPRAILSGAGSAWYDVVAEEFAAAAKDPGVQVLLRPGCYLTHDAGAYRRADARIHASNPVARRMADGLRPALQLWACVLSRPEPGRAIVGLGKRDAAFDAGLPLPVLHHRPGTEAPRAAPEHWRLGSIMDQHAFLDLDAGDDLRVGDLLCFDICHPCLTFDKWRHLLRVDDAWRVTGVVRTYF